MPLTGEYKPSTSEWARSQAELYEATNGAEGGELRGVPRVGQAALDQLQHFHLSLGQSGKVGPRCLPRPARDMADAALAHQAPHVLRHRLCAKRL